MPSLAVIKTWAFGLLAVGVAVLFGLWKASQLGRVKDKIKGIKRARTIERETAKIQAQGLVNEEKVKLNAKDNVDNPDYNPFK